MCGARSPEQQLLEANAEMARNLDALALAIANRDRYPSYISTFPPPLYLMSDDLSAISAAAEAALADVLESLKKNMMIAKAISANITDPARKQAVLGACSQMAAAFNAIKENVPGTLMCRACVCALVRVRVRWCQ